VRLPQTTKDDQAKEEQRLAVEFLARKRETGEYVRENIEQLVRMATSGDDAQEARATGAIFGSLVEALCDSFDPESVGLYIRVMAQIIQYCRKLDPRLDRELADFGLATEQDLIARAERLRPGPGSPAGLGSQHGWLEDPDRMKLVIILSRVTIGADVAITSVLVERLKQKFPGAALVLAGGVKTREVFGGDTRLSFAELEYGRRATLMERLRAWVDFLDIVRDATRGLQPDEFLVVDPDSRLTQLGMLPVAPDSSYLLFPSREYLPSSDESLARLASDWSGRVFGLGGIVQLPAVTIRPEDAGLALTGARALRRGQSRPVVSVNFGVGGNDKKQVGEDFEFAVLDFLLDTGAIVILDRGAGSSEDSRTDSIVTRLASKRTTEGASREFGILEADEVKLRAVSHGTPVEADLLIFNGRVGLLAGLIAASDLYIGYDSAGQHIAAAVGTPCIDVFAGYSSLRMLDRWRPTGPGRSIVIDAGTGRSIAEMTEEVKAAASHALEHR
jgi:ADP-heptose:LPS heptosyltransferase